MMTWGSILLTALLLPSAMQGQARLDAVVETKRFHDPGTGERVDVNISVIGSTALWTTDERGFQQAKVEALTMVVQDGHILDFRKSMVQSPDRADTVQGDFVHQEHFVLKPGSYALTVELHDANIADTAHTFVHVPLTVVERPSDVSLSDILFTLHQKPEKNKALTPFPGTYFPKESDKLGFYAEIYGTLDRFGKDGSFIAVAQVESFETHQVVGNFRHVQRMRSDTVVPFGLELGIEKLPTGNYLLALEVRDRNDSLVAERTQFFQRNNPFAYDPMSLMAGELGANFTDAFIDTDTLGEYVSSMRPIADEMERKMIDDRWTDKKPDLMRQLMYTFWYNRSPNDPKAAWEHYHEVVNYVNRKFGCRNLRGYQSDQGYIYLRYGAPNTVVNRSNETSTVPYMIWHYYRAGNYTDRRFVFYQPERSTTCWTLLTSDMPGELNNSRWLDALVPSNADGGIKRGEVQENYDHPR